MVSTLFASSPQNARTVTKREHHFAYPKNGQVVEKISTESPKNLKGIVV
jgi:hypothetical protein